MSPYKNLIRSSVAGLAIAAFAVPAMAADVVYQEPPAPAPQPIISTPVSDWSGPYAGLNFGYAFNGRVSDGTDSIDTDGWLGGVFGGWQQQNGMFVYGIEADANYARLGGSETFGGVDFEARSRLEGSLRGRLGVAVTDDVLVYGTAGGAAERLRVTGTLPGVASVSDTNTLLGYTVGAGVDAKLTDQVFGRVEYRFTDYGSKEFDFGAAGTADLDARNHRVTVGLGIQF